MKGRGSHGRRQGLRGGDIHLHRNHSGDFVSKVGEWKKSARSNRKVDKDVQIRLRMLLTPGH